jgi:hypothetical protein
MANTFTVQRNLDLLGRYRYTEIELMELMGSWAYTMVDPEIKIGYGRHNPVAVYFKETINVETSKNI